MRNDVTYLAITLGLFVLATLLVVACDRIIGPDDADLGVVHLEPATEQHRAAA